MVVRACQAECESDFLLKWNFPQNWYLTHFPPTATSVQALLMFFFFFFFLQSTSLLLLQWKLMMTHALKYDDRQKNITCPSVWLAGHQFSPKTATKLRFSQNSVLGSAATEFKILEICHELVSLSPQQVFLASQIGQLSFFFLPRTLAPHKE